MADVYGYKLYAAPTAKERKQYELLHAPRFGGLSAWQLSQGSPDDTGGARPKPPPLRGKLVRNTSKKKTAREWLQKNPGGSVVTMYHKSGGILGAIDDAFDHLGDTVSGLAKNPGVQVLAGVATAGVALAAYAGAGAATVPATSTALTSAAPAATAVGSISAAEGAAIAAGVEAGSAGAVAASSGAAAASTAAAGAATASTATTAASVAAKVGTALKAAGVAGPLIQKLTGGSSGGQAPTSAPAVRAAPAALPLPLLLAGGALAAFFALRV